MAGAGGRIRGRALGRFPLALPVGDVSISEVKNKTLLSTWRRLPHPHPWSGEPGIVIIANIYQAFAIGQSLYHKTLWLVNHWMVQWVLNHDFREYGGSQGHVGVNPGSCIPIQLLLQSWLLSPRSALETRLLLSRCLTLCWYLGVETRDPSILMLIKFWVVLFFKQRKQHMVKKHLWEG